MIWNNVSIIYIIMSFVTVIITYIVKERKNRQGMEILFKMLLGVIVIGMLVEEKSMWMNENKMPSIISIVVLLVTSSLIIVIIEMMRSRQIPKNTEIFLVILPLIAGLMILIKSENLMIALISLEIQGIILYFTVGYKNDNIRGKEGSLKYFATGAIATLMFLMGIALIYKETGYMDINMIEEANTLSYKVGGLLILIGLLIKIGVAPFHYWLIDAYEGAREYIILLLVIIPKIYIIYYIYLCNKIFMQNNLLLLTIIMTGVIGAIGAMKQTKIKRFIAYTIIFNNAYFLGIILLNKYYSMLSLTMSMVIYVIITMLNILPLIIIRFRDKKIKMISLRDYVSIKKSNYYLALIVSSGFISAAGLPPLIGFMGKLYSFFPIMELKYKFVIYILILITIITVYYYLRITVIIFFYKDVNIYLLEKIGGNTGKVLALYLFLSMGLLLNPSIMMMFVTS